MGRISVEDLSSAFPYLSETDISRNVEKIPNWIFLSTKNVFGVPPAHLFFFCCQKGGKRKYARSKNEKKKKSDEFFTFFVPINLHLKSMGEEGQAKEPLQKKT